VPSSASHNIVLPLRGVAQIKYEASGATTPARPSVSRTSPSPLIETTPGKDTQDKST
jgi:hypothetical protein